MTHPWGRLLPAVWLTACAVSQAADRPLVPPPLAPGDRARVHVLEQRTFVGLPTTQIRDAWYAGIVTAYAPEDSLALRRTAWILLPARPRHVVAYWGDISAIEVPDGRNLFGGVAGGVGFALGAAFSIAFADALICRPWGGTCVPGFWKMATSVALISVPVGAVVGGLSPRWKLVYWRRRY